MKPISNYEHPVFQIVPNHNQDLPDNPGYQTVYFQKIQFQVYQPPHRYQLDSPVNHALDFYFENPSF